MSETLAEEEKQRIRVELMTEIAKNEQDLEQCNKETGRYGREFLYNMFNRLWTYVKDIVTRPHKAEEEAARIARETAEIKDIMNRLEEQSRRSEEARIEMDRIVKEQTERQREEEERQIRETAAHLEKERAEKAELEARIKMMEEQMRRSEKARIEMERWIGEEKDRKIMEEEERRIREEEARIEREKAEAEERERKEKERIEKEEEDRKRKVVEERRLRIEADVKYLLALPYELRMQAYRVFDLEKRRELRINEDLAAIELKTEYFCEHLWIERKEDLVELSNWIQSDEKWKMCYEVFIPIADIEKELEIMGKNTQFDGIEIRMKSGDRQIINGMKSLKAKKIGIVRDSSLDEFDLRSLVKNRESVSIWSDSAVTVQSHVLMWIYENMRDGQFELNETSFYVRDEVRWNFLDKFGNFDRKSLTFTGTNPNQKVSEADECVIINEGKLTISVYKKKDEGGKISRIGFHFDC